MEKKLTQLASEKALEFCTTNPQWKRICDIDSEVVDSFYTQWNELPEKYKNYYGSEENWREFGNRKCKTDYGFISPEGTFCYRLPMADYNHMMVFLMPPTT